MLGNRRSRRAAPARRAPPQRRHRPLVTAVAAAPLLALAAAPAGASPVDDAFIAGYAAAVLDRDYRLPADTVDVRDGVVTVDGAVIAGRERARLVDALSRIRGVRRVELAGDRPLPAPGPVTLPPTAAPPSATPPATVPAADATPTQVATAPPSPGIALLPGSGLFQPLMADPRWPHFSASFQNINGSPELESGAAVSFGGVIPLLEDDAPWGGRWQIGILGSVFALFDRGSVSQDLINNDYFVGVPIEWRSGRWSAQARYYHQSSHLGDEFLLRGTGTPRVNLSFEVADLRLSYDIDEQFRVYGGGGRVLRSEPHLHPWLAQLGGEYTADWTFLRDTLRPVAGLDLQAREFQGWSPDLSLRAGVQLDNRLVAGRKVQLLLEYYNGKSPNGQFFDDDIEYLALGAHFYF